MTLEEAKKLGHACKECPEAVRRDRKKKPLQKWTQLYFYPIAVLNSVQNGQRIKYGHSIYKDLLWKLCSKVFYTKLDFNIHTSEIHNNDNGFSNQGTNNFERDFSVRNKFFIENNGQLRKNAE